MVWSTQLPLYEPVVRVTSLSLVVRTSAIYVLACFFATEEHANVYPLLAGPLTAMYVPGQSMSVTMTGKLDDDPPGEDMESCMISYQLRTLSN